MASLTELPTELLAQVLSCISAKSGLANLRLVNRRINEVTTTILFSHITLYAMYNAEDRPLPPSWRLGYDAQVFKNIIEHSALKTLVKYVTVYACETHCDAHPVSTYENWDGYLDCIELHDIWSDCFGRIAEFPNLRGITLCFDRHAGIDDGEDDDIYQNCYARYDIEDKVFRILNSVDQNRAIELAFRNYRRGVPDFASSPQWLNVLGRLVTLRLSVVHIEYDLESSSSRREGKLHSFWRVFPEFYLRPTMSTLKHLILYSDLRLGWFPKLDLRKIYFSKLQSLTLGHFVFTHEWQFEWILSHRATLRSLYLDHCSILYQAGFTIAGWLDEENYPQPDLSGDFGISGDLWPPDDEMKAAMTFVSYKVRWHDFFLSCADELCQLEDFRFGSSKQWNFNTRSRYPDDTDEPLPIMPWEAERKLENEIYEDAYVHYNDWKECYKAGDWEYKGNEDWKPEWQARMESPPDCKDEDEAALKLLLYKVGLKTGKVKT